MDTLSLFFLLSLITQVAHSIEELATGFHMKWYLFKMPFWIFLTFEILFTGFWFIVLLVETLPMRVSFQTFFLFLMLANGVQHLIWWLFEKTYVPGLVTAPIHIAVFLAFYFSVLY